METYKQLIKFEKTVDQLTKTFLEEHNIPYIDTLPALQSQAELIQLYPTNLDGHPNHNGYRVIAETVAAEIR